MALVWNGKNAFVVSPPYSRKMWSKSEEYLNIESTKSLGLSWNEGHVKYKRIQSLLEIYVDQYSTIFVHGATAEQRMKLMFPMNAVINMESIGCPEEVNAELEIDCECAVSTEHKNSVKCALKRAVSYKVWLKNNYDY